MEFARADHLVAKLCEVLKYHQKFDTHAEKAKNSKNTKLQELKNVKLSTGSQCGKRSGVGWLGEGLPQNPLCREECSRADFIEWPFKLPSNDIPPEKANTDSREASKCDTLFLRECTRTRSVLTCREVQT